MSKFPPRVQATAKPTEQEIRLMEMHMFGRELEAHERPAPAEPAAPEHDTESDDGGNEG